MKKIIANLVNEKSEICHRIYEIDTAINALQKLCPHTYEDGRSAKEYVGHNHNDDVYVCSICQKQINE